MNKNQWNYQALHDRISYKIFGSLICTKLTCLTFRGLALSTLYTFSLFGHGQSGTGQHVFSFLRFPATPQQTALGGVNISSPSNDVGLAFQNPALLRPDDHGRLSLGFTSLPADIRQFQFCGAYHLPEWNSSFLLGVQYLSYGQLTQTDASGNIIGAFRASDYVVQLSSARRYLQRWHYGAAIKFIYSNYGIYQSTGIALDFGGTYTDSANNLQLALVLKNMGLQLSAYSGTERDDLPFEIQVGVTKRLKNAPIQLSLTGHNLHQWPVYADSLNEDSKFNFRDVISHFIFSAQIYVEERLELSIGYNHLRQRELSILSGNSVLSGISFGAGVFFKNIQIRYSRAFYQNNTGYNQFGLNLQVLKNAVMGKSAGHPVW